jgi:hypothetical protein
MTATAGHLFEGADWDFSKLQHIHDACEEIARSELGSTSIPARSRSSPPSRCWMRTPRPACRCSTSIGRSASISHIMRPADLPVVQSTKFELVDAKPRLSMSGFTKACVRRQRDDFRVRKSGCKRVANPRAPAGAIRQAIAPYGRYNAASLPKVQSTGYLDTIQNKARSLFRRR